MQLKVEGARSCRCCRVLQFKCKEKFLEDFKEERRELDSLLQKIDLSAVSLCRWVAKKRVEAEMPVRRPGGAVLIVAGTRVALVKRLEMYLRSRMSFPKPLHFILNLIRFTFMVSSIIMECFRLQHSNKRQRQQTDGQR